MLMTAASPTSFFPAPTSCVFHRPSGSENQHGSQNRWSAALLTLLVSPQSQFPTDISVHASLGRVSSHV